MDEIKKVNLKSQKVKKSYLKHFITVFAVASVIFIATFLWSVISSTSTIFQYAVPAVFDQSPIESTNDRVNVLLLGNAGGRHDGASLTDTIIVASYNLKTKKVVMFSLPRDLWLDDLKIKVNAVYESKNSKNENLKYSMDKIDDLVGIPIHYGVRVDFNGFEKAVDLVGGIDVNVPKSFEDYNYPIEGKERDLCGNEEKEIELNEEQAKALNLTVGKHLQILTPEGKVASTSADFSCRFEKLAFKKGLNHFDGKTALKFVRSRQGTNGEGSDFARSRRQQLVIQAFREKALSISTLTDISKVTKLISTFGNSVETNVPLKDYLDFYKLFKEIKEIKSVVLGDLGNGKSLLYTPPPSQYGGAFVLIPKNNDFELLREYVIDALNDKEFEQTGSN